MDMLAPRAEEAWMEPLQPTVRRAWAAEGLRHRAQDMEEEEELHLQPL